jgi:ribosomal protein L37AE/L43A
MSTAVRRQAYTREVYFLCPSCRCDLRRTTHTYDSEPVWECRFCFYTYTYQSSGWVYVALRAPAKRLGCRA